MNPVLKGCYRRGDFPSHHSSWGQGGGRVLRSSRQHKGFGGSPQRKRPAEGPAARLCSSPAALQPTPKSLTQQQWRCSPRTWD